MVSQHPHAGRRDEKTPATLLLRPFNFETLATQIYTFASQEQFERSALAALIVIAVGLVPLLLHRALSGVYFGELLQNGPVPAPEKG